MKRTLFTTKMFLVAQLCAVFAFACTEAGVDAPDPVALQMEFMSDDVAGVSYVDQVLSVSAAGAELRFELYDNNGGDFSFENVEVAYGSNDKPEWLDVTLSGDDLTVSVLPNESKTETLSEVVTIKSSESYVEPLEFTVNQAVKPLDTAAQLTGFTVEGSTSDAVIDEASKEISIVVGKDVDVTAIAPAIEISEFATIVPASGEAQDFTEPVLYTVTSEDGSMAVEYTVSVSVFQSSEALITGFSLYNQNADAVIDDAAGTITVDVAGTDVSNLTPTIVVSDYATVTPASGEAQDFTKPVVYTVTSEDGAVTKSYTVNLKGSMGTEAKLLSISIGSEENGPIVEGVIDQEKLTIHFEVPFMETWTYGYSVPFTAVVSGGATGKKVNKDWYGHDFGPNNKYQSFVVTSEDGKTVTTYTSSTSIAKCPDAKVLVARVVDDKNAGLPGVFSAAIDEETKTITVYTLAGADASNIMPKLKTSPKSAVECGEVWNLSSENKVVVTSEDEATVATYTVVRKDITFDDVANKIDMIKVATNGGTTFSYGASAEPKYDVSYKQDVTLTKDFAISKYEITNDLFEMLMGYIPSENSTEAGYPVTNVSWYEAALFCNRLSEIAGLTPVYTFTSPKYSGYTFEILSSITTFDLSADGYRLPTDAEWEFAAKGGVETKGYIYAGGNDVETVAWYGANTSKYNNAPQPVGEKLPNELGLYDMSGNVMEWVNDWVPDTYKYPGFYEIEDVDPVGGSQKDFVPDYYSPAYKMARNGGANKTYLQDLSTVINSRQDISFASETLGIRIAIGAIK